MDERLAGKDILVFIILAYRDIEVAHDALVLPELKIRPLPVVHKLLKSLLQIIEYPVFRALNLCMVDGNLSLQLLSG